MISTPASLDARVRIPARLERLGMSQRFFASLCDVPQPEFSRLMSGGKTLTGKQTEEFCKVLDQVEELVALLKPFVPAWTDAESLREFLKSPRFDGLFDVLTKAQVSNHEILAQSTSADFAVAQYLVGLYNDDISELQRLEQQHAEEWKRFSENVSDWTRDLP